MIELVVLLVFLGGFIETARRRGVPGWPFAIVGGVGFFLFGAIGAALFGQGPNMLFSWGWVVLVYFLIFLIGGGGRRLRDTWQCPNCRLFNPPSTLICPCGQPAPDDA